MSNEESLYNVDFICNCPHLQNLKYVMKILGNLKNIKTRI